MQYHELIQFTPVESVVKLKTSGEPDKAAELVSSFVISERMAENLTVGIIPQLQFQTPKDNMGLMILGNYGTGKSHLMSVIAALAEDADRAKLLSNEQVRETAGQIAGRFIVLRDDIGSVTGSLRQIICTKLEQGLADIGVDYTFPPQDTIVNHHDALDEMMARFHTAYPTKGLLLIMDELLDFLRSRNALELRKDLGFLRELGEFCKSSRFRFITGIQESLYDSPHFVFAATELRRVQERFLQVRISREDVSFVVAERLLKKSSAQKAQVREYLLKFAKLYGHLGERTEEYVSLFPIHPTYLEIFERVHAVEKREVLTTISNEIARLLSQEVPQEYPGLISYDAYWLRIKENPAYRVNEDIRTVMDTAEVLEGKIQQQVSIRYRQVALRILYGLAVHRLTTGGINQPIGPTAENLRDGLCLTIAGMPEQDSGMLSVLVQRALKEIQTAVNGQFITHNATNGQYYIDIAKTEDYDQYIINRATILDKPQLDTYFFDTLAQVMECAEATYRPGFDIWQHEVEWSQRQVTRQGYLFFGAPNERPNTVPARDFYLYFLEPYEPTEYKDLKRADEVFFRLTYRDEEFEDALKHFAAARELWKDATDAKKIYADKATTFRKRLVEWLQINMATAFEVTYQGKKQSLATLIRGKVAGMGDIRQMINTAGSICLGGHFEEIAPEYPAFTKLITSENRVQATTDALRLIAGVKSQLGGAVLEGLRLVENGQVRPHNSPYAKALLAKLKAKGQKVINRAELITEDGQIEYWSQFRLEPEFLAVILAALAMSGDLVIGMGQSQKKIDAAEQEQLLKLSTKDLAKFQHIEQPKEFPVAALRTLFELLGLAPGLMVHQEKHEEGIVQLDAKVRDLMQEIAKALSQVPHGLPFWGQPLLSEADRADWKAKLQGLKGYLEGLLGFNTPGKLKNFPPDVEQVKEQLSALKVLADYRALVDLLAKVQELTTYLTTAEYVLGAEHPWRATVTSLRHKLVGQMADPVVRASSAFVHGVMSELSQAKQQYVDAYATLHKRARLDVNQSKRLAQLISDPRLQQLQRLAPIEIFPKVGLQTLQNQLGSLKSCAAFYPTELQATPVCPHCGFRPSDEGAQGEISARLDQIDEQIERLLQDVTGALLKNLADPLVEQNLELMTDPEAKAVLVAFRAAEALPEPVDSLFVKAVGEVLSDLRRVPVTRGMLEAAVFGAGAALNQEQVRANFEAWLKEQLKGKNPAQVRFVLE